MLITVTICTWNRSGLLDQTLTEMHKLEIPPGVEWELLVVNNNCTDNTDEVVARHVDALPIRLLHEPTPGLSNARNCAVAAASGEYILWTDDDVLVDSRWLAEYAAAVAQWPDAAFFGGPIQPWFEPPTPLWLEEAFPIVASAFAMRDLGAEPIACDTLDRCPYGANYAVRTDVQRRYPYDMSYGYTKTSKVGGEELAVLSQILVAGFTGRWIPIAKIRHFIPQDRQTVDYLRRYYFGYGQLLAIRRRNAGIPIGFVVRCKLFVRAIESDIRGSLAWICNRHDSWAHHLVAASTCRGKLHG